MVGVVVVSWCLGSFLCIVSPKGFSEVLSCRINSCTTESISALQDQFLYHIINFCTAEVILYSRIFAVLQNPVFCIMETQNPFLRWRINAGNAESTSVLQNQFLYSRKNFCTAESHPVLHHVSAHSALLHRGRCRGQCRGGVVGQGSILRELSKEL